MPDLPLGPNPVLAAHRNSRVVIIGQAPGKRVHETSIPWDDLSGDRLRSWLGVSKEDFYNPEFFALMPMGFCYPGKGKSGDLPPRPECAPTWHESLLSLMPSIKLAILIGNYAHSYYLPHKKKKTLTETVKNFKDYYPDYMVLPHPSPRNNIWIKKNPWFTSELLPELSHSIEMILDGNL